MPRQQSKRHKLGFGRGTITEYEDGTASFKSVAALREDFRVRISDITGFSLVAVSNKLLRPPQLNIFGNGTLLGATASVTPKEAQIIEQWFRSHPDFGKNAPLNPAPTSVGSVADELQKLAQLHEQGVLTDSEFSAAKQRLLGS